MLLKWFIWVLQGIILFLFMQKNALIVEANISIRES